LDLAAEQGQVKRDTLTVADGKVSGPGGKPSFEFGPLTKGKKQVKVIDDKTPTTPPEKWAVAGTPLPKVDGAAFVTGAHRYASDAKRPGMLCGKVLRPPAFKAKMTLVQTREAEAMEGVVVVRDGDFVGVVAPTEHRAAKALAAVRAEWKLTEQPSSDELSKYLKEHPAAGRGGPGGGRPTTRG